jgi:hypothetical protein
MSKSTEPQFLAKARKGIKKAAQHPSKVYIGLFLYINIVINIIVVVILLFLLQELGTIMLYFKGQGLLSSSSKSRSKCVWDWTNVLPTSFPHLPSLAYVGGFPFHLPTSINGSCNFLQNRM